MSKPRNKVGRPNIYDTRIKPYLEVISFMKSVGKPDTEICEMLQISPNAFLKHKKKVDEFMRAYAHGREHMVDVTEATVFDIAYGRTQKITLKERRDGAGNLIGTEKIVEQLPPDFSAVKFILKGLRREVWNDKHFEEEMPPEVISFTEKFIEAIDDKAEETDG